MNRTPRPTQATIFCMLFLAAALAMLALGVDAHAYYLPAASLLACALMLWRGTGGAWFKRVLTLNQLTAIVLILDLWLGELLHLPKLAISAAMLGANLLLGGPLMGVLAIAALGCMHFNATLANWLKGTA
ncbi:MAG: hypothetical protein V4484_22915 [Pseudomonadota bacterium]